MPVSKKPRHKRNLGKNKMISRHVGASKIVSLLSRSFDVIIKGDEDVKQYEGRTFLLTDVFVAGAPGTIQMIKEYNL